MKIEGRNSLIEAIKNNVTIDKVMAQKGNNKDGSFMSILNKLKEKNIKVQFCEKDILDKNSETHKHQGFIAFATDFQYSTVEEILEKANKEERPPFLLLLDEINDPHNLGSIIRTAECMGVDGIIIPKNRAASVNETVVKVSMGACVYMKVAKVTNINQTIDYLKKQNIFVIGTDANGHDIEKTNLKGALALVIGGEDKGLGVLTRKLCDDIVSIPMFGNISSLNASVACGMALYEAIRQRRK